MNYTFRFWYLLVFFLVVASSPKIVLAQTITTFAGGFGDDSSAVIYGRLNRPCGVAVDATGNIFILDEYTSAIRKVSAATGKIKTIQRLPWSISLAIDNVGNLYIGGNDSYIRKLDTSGALTIIAGTGVSGYSGDGSAATSASISWPKGINVDGSGNLFFADNINNRIRKISTSGIITTVAGSSAAGFSGDGGPATAALLDRPTGVCVDGSGNLFVADYNNQRIRKINTAGVITTFAGGGTGGYGDGGPATNARVYPYQLAVDIYGNVYLTDFYANVRQINIYGVINTFAGGSATGFTGDGGQATAAKLYTPTAIAVTAANNVFIADQDNNRIRKVASSGIITTVAGSGISLYGYGGDGGNALLAEFQDLGGIRSDTAGNVYVSDANRIRKINTTSGIVTTVAGIGSAGFSGDGGSATAAQLQTPLGMAFDNFGNLFIADKDNHHVRKINSSGVITTVAGGGTTGLGDGGQATAAEVVPAGVAVDTAGNLYIAEADSSRVRKVNAATGIISTVAGTGITGAFYGTYYSSGDGGPATSATFFRPADVAMDKRGNLFIADGIDVRKVNPAGIISTVASGLNGAYSLSLDTVGNLYIGTTNGARVYRLDTNNYIHAVAGNGVAGYWGDNGPAILAEIMPTGVAISHHGQLYITNYSSAIRKVCCLSARVDQPPVFIGGDTQSTVVCMGSASNPINSLLQVSDLDAGDSVKWTIVSPPYFGSLNGFPYTTLSTGSLLSTSGLTYTPPSGFSGSDVFIVRVCDGTDTNFTTISVSVSPATSAGTISGSSSVCMGSPVTLYSSGATAAGTWRCTNSNASITASGIVTGAAAGADTVLFIVANACGTDTAAKAVRIYSSPAGTTISGPSSVCISSTVSLTASAAGGTWGSADNTIATVSTTGVVTPVSSGHVNIYYNISNPCGYSSPNQVVTVNLSPTAGSLTGSSAICRGASAALSASITGGTWRATNVLATISSSGIVTGVNAGIDSILYTVSNSCGSDTAIRPVTIDTPPFSGTISGPDSVCVSSSVTLSSSAAGGHWSSPSSYISIGTTSGMISGVAPGTATVFYSVSNSCGTAIDSASMLVLPVPAAGSISGATTLCIGSTTVLTISGVAGYWSSSDPSIATVDAAGSVTGVSSGAVLISYAVSSVCGTAAAVTLLNVITSATISVITGPSSVCSGSTIALSDATAGGTWSSSTSSVASVSSSGVVYPVSPGVAAISYTVSAGCGTSVALSNITVNAMPVSGTISGPAALCIGTSALLSASVAGGTWLSSDTTVATISVSGIITGRTSGTVTFSYMVSNSCGSAYATLTLTVYPAPASGTITGATSVCAGLSDTLAESVSGGVWSTSSSGIATVDAAGIVTGISGGTALISYTVATGCGAATTTATITISAPSAGTLTGITTICAGDTTSVASTVAGGSWISSTVAVATITGSGLVTGIAPGATVITYTATTSCGVATSTVVLTVGSLPVVAPVAGASALCVGSTTTFTDATSGGSWSCGSMPIATISSTGVLTALSAGTTAVFYAVTAGCGTTTVNATITVETAPSAGIIGGNPIQCLGATILFTESASGGVWASSNSAIASVSSTGMLTGIATGTATISYSVSNTCGTVFDTLPVTIITTPNPGPITGITSFCQGSTITLTDTIFGGTWVSANPAVGSVNSSGSIFGNSAGTVVISYAVTNICRTSFATVNVTVNPKPYLSAISGTSTVPEGSTTNLANAVPGGIWTSSDPVVATVSSSGIVTGITAGVAIISYAMTNTYGCSSDTTLVLVVTKSTGISNLSTQPAYQLFPNPSTGDIAISWQNLPDPITLLTLTDVAGREVFTTTIKTNQLTGTTQLNLSTLQPGIYAVTLRSLNSNYTSKLVVE